MKSTDITALAAIMMMAVTPSFAHEEIVIRNIAQSLDDNSRRYHH